MFFLQKEESGFLDKIREEGIKKVASDSWLRHFLDIYLMQGVFSTNDLKKAQEIYSNMKTKDVFGECGFEAFCDYCSNKNACLYTEPPKKVLLDSP